jgi:hypothetical protein
MILLGLDNAAKDTEIARYCREHDIAKVFVLSPEKFRFPCSIPNHEVIEWAEIIEYRFYYRLLQEVDRNTLIVVNECLRTQNRYELTYNCIRLFLNQTSHQLVFQYLPLIDTIDDFMVLFDFDTRSRWKREKFRLDLLKEATIRGRAVPLELAEIPVETDERTKAAYAREKRKLIDGIGLKDPHTIPRNLYLMSGKAKLGAVEADRYYVGRNNRFKLERFRTYRELAYPHESTVFEFCHNFIDFADFLALSRQLRIEAIVADLKVDWWYLARYREWIGRVRDAYPVLRLEEDRA